MAIDVDSLLAVLEDPAPEENWAKAEPVKGDHIRVRNVDFGTNKVRAFTASLMREKGGHATIEVRLDRVDGPLFATLSVSDAPAAWTSFTTEAKPASGVHDVYLVFRGERDAVQVDWWRVE